MFPKELEAFPQKQKKEEENSSGRKIVFTADSLFADTNNAKNLKLSRGKRRKKSSKSDFLAKIITSND
jgi:hypothetical protein